MVSGKGEGQWLVERVRVRVRVRARGRGRGRGKGRVRSCRLVCNRSRSEARASVCLRSSVSEPSTWLG